MSPIRKLLFVGVGVLALHGLQACASETELNPQPLPPRGVGGGENTPVPPPEDKTGDMAGSSGSSSGTSGTPSSAADGGPDGDADGSGDADDAGVH